MLACFQTSAGTCARKVAPSVDATKVKARSETVTKPADVIHSANFHAPPGRIPGLQNQLCCPWRPSYMSEVQKKMGSVQRGSLSIVLLICESWVSCDEFCVTNRGTNNHLSCAKPEAASVGAESQCDWKQECRLAVLFWLNRTKYWGAGRVWCLPPGVEMHPQWWAVIPVIPKNFRRAMQQARSPWKKLNHTQAGFHVG